MRLFLKKVEIVIELKKSKILPWVSFALFAIIVCSYGLLAINFPHAYIWATYEDLFGEWVQFWSFLFAMFIAGRVAVIKSPYRWFFGILALSCFYVAGEEISWGQRLLGFGSGEFFKTHNLQGEANLHNLLTGPFSTVLKSVITYILGFALLAYGLIYPWILRQKESRFHRLEQHGLAASPLYLWPFWVAAAVLELGPFGFNEAEVAEVLVGFALVFLGIHYAFVLKQKEENSLVNINESASRKIMIRILVVTALVLNLSALTTLSIYATDRGREKILKRIDSGIEKFAGRYARFENWEIAIALYKQAIKKDKGSMSLRRKLAVCYRDSGDIKQFESVLGEALKKDLKRYKKDPGAASVHRSLVRSYRLLGADKEAETHINMALHIGQTRIKNHPTSANAAYSLGRTLALLGREAEALVQYARAVELKPTSKKFKKAYIKAKTGKF